MIFYNFYYKNWFSSLDIPDELIELVEEYCCYPNFEKYSMDYDSTEKCYLTLIEEKYGSSLDDLFDICQDFYVPKNYYKEMNYFYPEYFCIFGIKIKSYENIDHECVCDKIETINKNEKIDLEKIYPILGKGNYYINNTFLNINVEKVDINFDGFIEH